MKKSIIEINALPRERFSNWRSRLAEVDVADDATAKELACQHFSRALDEEICAIRRALKEQTSLAKMSKSRLKAIGKWQARDAAECVFRSWCVMDRLEPGSAAIKKLAGGELSQNLREIWQQIWQTLKKADEARQKFYSPANSSAERLSIDLSEEIGPLCDELKNWIVAFYTIAKSRYGLLALNGQGML